MAHSTDVSLVKVPVHETGEWRIRVTTCESDEAGTYALVAGALDRRREHASAGDSGNYTLTAERR